MPSPTEINDILHHQPIKGDIEHDWDLFFKELEHSHIEYETLELVNHISSSRLEKQMAPKRESQTRSMKVTEQIHQEKEEPAMTPLKARLLKIRKSRTKEHQLWKHYKYMRKYGI